MGRPMNQKRGSMRTQEEIVTAMREEDDYFGFRGSTLIDYLEYDYAKQFLKDDFTERSDAAEVWATENRGIAGSYEDVCRVLVKSDIKTQMVVTADFGWLKLRDHRGLSMCRVLERMRAWLWLLGDEELLSFATDDANHPQYGAPILKAICEKYELPIPEDEYRRRMMSGERCGAAYECGCK